MSEHQQSDLDDDRISELDHGIPKQEEDVSVHSQGSQGRGRPRVQE